MKAIETIEVGDRVFAKDDTNPDGPLKECVVTAVKHNPPSATYRLIFRFSNGYEMTKRVTPEHPFWVPQRGWIAVENLELGDVCVGMNGETSTLVSKVFDPELIPVYNLEVEGCHTYFVGDDPKHAMLVHNQYTITPQKFGNMPRKGTPHYWTVKDKYPNILWRGNWNRAEKDKIIEGLSVLESKLPRLLDDITTSKSMMPPSDHSKIRTDLEKYEKILKNIQGFFDGKYSLKFKQWPESDGPLGRYYMLQGMIYLNNSPGLADWKDNSPAELAALLAHEMSHKFGSIDDISQGVLNDAHKIQAIVASDSHLIYTLPVRSMFNPTPKYLLPKIE